MCSKRIFTTEKMIEGLIFLLFYKEGSGLYQYIQHLNNFIPFFFFSRLITILPFDRIPFLPFFLFVSPFLLSPFLPLKFRFFYGDYRRRDKRSRIVRLATDHRDPEFTGQRVKRPKSFYIFILSSGTSNDRGFLIMK